MGRVPRAGDRKRLRRTDKKSVAIKDGVPRSRSTRSELDDAGRPAVECMAARYRSENGRGESAHRLGYGRAAPRRGQARARGRKSKTTLKEDAEQRKRAAEANRARASARERR